MPRDLPLDCQPPSAVALPSNLMLPVHAPAQVWALARQAFGVAPVEQLPLRARFLDVLEHLNRGHPLALLGATVPALWLDGYPDIALLAGVLFTYGYVEIAGRHRENPAVVYFTLSEAGLRKLQEGRAWWNALSFWQRLRVRFCG
jgi:hypothetical protein